MAVGEKKFSTKGREARKFTSEPFPAGDYDLKLLGNTVEIRKAEGKTDDKGNPVPTFSYINMAFEALGTGQDGGKNRRVYHSLFLRLKPSDKDGSVMTDRADQLVGLARGLGVELEDVSLAKQNGEDIVGPKALSAWLKSQDGAVLKGHIRISKERKYQGKTYPARNEIEYFIEAEGGSGPGEEEEDEEGEESEELESEEVEEGEEAEESEDEEIEEDIEEEEPAKKPAPKKAAPAKKVVKKGKR